jgi:hypothetical protein
MVLYSALFVLICCQIVTVRDAAGVEGSVGVWSQPEMQQHSWLLRQSDMDVSLES